MQQGIWKRLVMMVAILMLGSLVLVACGDDDDDDADPTNTTGAAATTEAEDEATEPMAEATEPADDATEPAGDDEPMDLGDLEGRVNIDGSSTVYPVTQAMAEEFNQVAPNVQVPVGISGTGGGFEKFCNGEIDISDASRPIKPEEAELCEANGIEFIEIPVAFDGLSVMVNPENDWVDCITVEELTTIWSPEAEGEITRWNQVNPEWPDEELVLYGAGTDSGTYDYFTSVITGEEGSSRGDFTGSEDDNILVQGIAGDQNALGFFGYAYYLENQDSLKLLGVDDGDDSNGAGCVQPSEETITDGTYQPLSRPIFIYVNSEAADREEVGAFIQFYLIDGPTIIPEIGYIPFTADFYDTLWARFEARTTGSVFEGEGSTQGVTINDLLFPDEQ